MDQGGIGYLLDTFKFPAYGQIDFYCVGDGVEQEWVVPVGVTSISAVLIGGGGSGGLGLSQREQDGGGGAGLRYINGMRTVPGETLKICVGCGGTAVKYPFLQDNSLQERIGFPGGDSYIASDNNATAPGRTGIGDTIIVFAGGGSQKSFTIPASDTVEGVNRVTTGAGGTGSVPGSYAWGTIAGGNGGYGGPESQRGGGAVDGGGGGAGGWLVGVAGTGGGGGFFPLSGGTGNASPPTNGSGGAGGGGMYTDGGGGAGGGGGGGTGVIWGQGPSGNGAQNGVLLSNTEFTSWCGQGGSYGADGKAVGTEAYGTTEYANLSGQANPPASYWNYANQSIGNGVRGYNNSIGDDDDGSLTGDNIAAPILDGGVVVDSRMGAGGLWGGGGGGADTTGQARPQSGYGGDGIIRIIFTVRFNRQRNYPSPNNTDNPLSNWGYPTKPPAEGGPALDETPNIVGSFLPEKYSDANLGNTGRDPLDP